MKLCWDNIENIRLTKNGSFRDITKKRTYYLSVCKQCDNEFLGSKKNSKYCCFDCSTKKCSDETKKKMSDSHKGENHPNWGKKLSKETKKKISEKAKLRTGDKNPFFGKTHNNESKKKMSEAAKLRIGNKNSFFGKKHTEKTKKKLGKVVFEKKLVKKKNPNWRGGYRKRGLAYYDSYAPQLEWVEEVRRNKEDLNVLEVRCFKCNKWYIPAYNNVNNRIQTLKDNYNNSNHFYCSDECKHSCSVFGKSVNSIMKEDAIRSGRLSWLELTREVQPELRKMVLERDNNKCTKCNNTEDLQCHHILPANIEPLLSADVDNCITLCKECHKKVHQEVDGCKYSQLHIKEC